MGRPASQSVQVPGAQSSGDDVDEEGVHADADVVQLSGKAADSSGTAKLKAQLAAANAENASLRAAAEVSKLPQVVYEPNTPHGVAARASSAFGHLTVNQLMAEIDAGRVREPINSVLCADGYYARRP